MKRSDFGHVTRVLLLPILIGLTGWYFNFARLWRSYHALNLLIDPDAYQFLVIAICLKFSAVVTALDFIVVAIYLFRTRSGEGSKAKAEIHDQDSDGSNKRTSFRILLLYTLNILNILVQASGILIIVWLHTVHTFGPADYARQCQALSSLLWIQLFSAPLIYVGLNSRRAIVLHWDEEKGAIDDAVMESKNYGDSTLCRLKD